MPLPLFRLAPAALAVLLAGPVAAQAPATVQPGAPGQASRTLSAQEAEALARPGITDADVRFMQDMIHHHAQAVEMTQMVPERAASPAVQALARRIEASQADEIAFMQQWLARHGHPAPATDPHAGHHGHATHDHAAHGHHDHREGAHHDRPARHHGHAGHQDRHAGHDQTGHHDHHAGHDDASHPHAGMPGMLSPEQLARLAAARGDAFDRLFLEFMIYHHEGALVMVDELLASPGAAQETTLFRFASHVDADQRVEIARMQAMLAAPPQPVTE